MLKPLLKSPVFKRFHQLKTPGVSCACSQDQHVGEGKEEIRHTPCARQLSEHLPDVERAEEASTLGILSLNMV